MSKTLVLSCSTPSGFGFLCHGLDKLFFGAPEFDRGEWQAKRQLPPDMVTKEIPHALLEIPMPASMLDAQRAIGPNLPWAEDHFQERVSGEPLNPPPSNEWWPHAVAGNKQHKGGGKFSHTYPERFWPKWAGEAYEDMPGSSSLDWQPNVGIRFEYGDLQDLINMLKRNPRTRQAYLPVWFPEDLAAAGKGQRVPCTIGYHFLLGPNNALDVTYTIRSCDYIRHFRDDVYMAMRLCQWIIETAGSSLYGIQPGMLYMHIGSFHVFKGDDAELRRRIDEAPGYQVAPLFELDRSWIWPPS